MAAEEIENRVVKIWLEGETEEINSLTLASMLKEKRYEDLKFLVHLDVNADKCTGDGERIQRVDECFKKYGIAATIDGAIIRMPSNYIAVDVKGKEHHLLIFEGKEDP